MNSWCIPKQDTRVIPGTSLRLKFLPVQENLPEPGFVVNNGLRAEIVIQANVANYL